MKNSFGTHVFLLAAFLLFSAVMLAGQYLNNPSLEFYPEIAFALIAVATLLLGYSFIVELNHNALNYQVSTKSMASAKLFASAFKENEADGSRADMMRNMLLTDASFGQFFSDFISYMKGFGSNSPATENPAPKLKQHASNSLHSSILNSLPANIAILNSEGEIVEANESWVRFVHANGLSNSAFTLGQNYIQVTECANVSDKLSGKKIADGIRQVINGCVPSFEIEYPLPFGTEKRWFSVEITPYNNRDGAAAVVTHHNITERKRAQEELQHTNNLIYKLTNQVPLAVYQFEMAPDGQMRFPFVSKGIERILPWLTVEDVIADSSIPFSKIHAEEIENLMLSIEHSRQTITDWEKEYRMVMPNGEIKWMLASARPERKEDGTVVWYGYILDIDERKRKDAAFQELNEHLEERVNQRTVELTEANKALEAFSYSVSHDLRSPLRALVGFSNLIRKDYGHTLAPEALDMFGHIETSSRRMNLIIDDLLTLAKYGKEKLKITKVNMNELFANAWQHSQFFAKNNPAFHLSILPVIQADVSMLEQVVVNLLSNAVKYSSKKENPQVQVGYSETGNSFIFYVKDNGAGFDMKNYDRLFGAFQRLHCMTDFEGTGVGLMLVKRIVEKHNGRVWAEAIEGEGATFYMELPK